MKRSRSSRKKRKVVPRRRSPPGTSPGMVVADPTALPTHIRIMAYDATRFEEHANASVEDVRKALINYSTVWVNIEGLSDAKIIEEMGQIFHLHRLALEDVVNVHQRAKTEQYDENVFFVAPMSLEGDCYHAEQVSIFLGPHFVLTFQEGHPGDAFELVRLRLRSASGKIRGSGPDYLAYALIDALIDSFYPTLELYGERLDALEDDLVADRRDVALIDELHAIRADLRHIRRAIWPQREAVGELLRESTHFIQDSTRVYLRDCYDHVVQLIDLLETYRELAADLRDLHMSTVSNRINETMRILTIISTIFIPLTFIAGIYGMNFDVHVSPWNMPELEWVYGYPFALGLMVLVTLIMLYIFWRMGWIGRGKRVFSPPPPSPGHRE